MLKKLIGIIIFSLLSIGIASAQDYSIDQIGVTSFKGYENRSINPPSNYEFSVNRATLFASKYLEESRRWKLEGELQFSAFKAFNENENIDTNEIAFDLIFKREFIPKPLPIFPYLGIMGGTGYITDTKNQPSLDTSHWSGRFGGVARIDIPIDDNLMLRLEGRLTHTSEPLGKDVGRNMNEVGIGLLFNF